MRERDFALVNRGELYGGVAFTKSHIPVSKPNEINAHMRVVEEKGYLDRGRALGVGWAREGNEGVNMTEIHYVYERKVTMKPATCNICQSACWLLGWGCGSNSKELALKV